MKKYFLKIFSVSVLLLLLTTTCTKEKHVAYVTLSKPTLTLKVGESAILTATVYPPEAINKNVIWSTGYQEIVAIENGFLTAISEGIATITVTTEDGNHTSHCIVTVIHPGESEMLMVNGGTFTMGISDNENPVHTVFERPTHQVTLTSFKIAKYPVTQKQWSAIMEENPSHFKDDNLPVENVSWYDAQTFISRLNEATGKSYRLPTEAEWEYAARGGNKSKGYKYSGSDNLDLVGWYTFNSKNISHPAGNISPNELGIYDMSGNIWEWCQDWAAEYSNKEQTNPQGPETGTCRIARGGSYRSDYLLCRVSFRNSINPNEHNSETGFRIVLVENP